MAASTAKSYRTLTFVVSTISFSFILNALFILGRHSFRLDNHVEERLESFTSGMNTKRLASVSLDDNVMNKSLSEVVSACLLIKDDNDLLNEWIAYHFFATNLRYLVVAVDPESTQSPLPSLKKWYENTDLNVTVWSDKDFMPTDFLEKGYHIPPRFISGNASASKWHEGFEDPEKVRADRIKINNHRFRQKRFLAKCLRHMKSTGRTWTFHVDTDEYITINPIIRKSQSAFGFVPSPESPGYIWTLLKRIQSRGKLRKPVNYPCISMPRLLFGSTESEPSLNGTAPYPFQINLFETLRWQYHASYIDKERNAQPKVMVDVSAIDIHDEMFGNKVFSIHRPSKKLCRRIDQISFHSVEKYPFTVNHYIGTWERYKARNDTRRSRRFYDYKAQVKDGKDTFLHTWLKGFVRAHGYDQSVLLLNNYKAHFV